MKGAFELSLVLTFGMMLLMGSISIVGVMMNVHHGRFYQEVIVATIEHHNHYDPKVIADIEQQYRCSFCQATIKRLTTGQYLVSVTFPIQIPLISYQSVGVVKGLTIPIP